MGKLTPIDIQHAEFARRAAGYDRREVKAFLERLSFEVEESIREAQSLRRTLAERDAEILRLRSAEAELQTAVVSAERVASDMREAAKREAQQLVAEAERQRSARLADIESELHRSRAQIDVLNGQRRLFKQQFKALLFAYLTSLDADDAVLAVDASAALLDDSVEP